MIEGLSPAVAACACSATSGESKMPLRQWPSFQPYPFKAAREVHQNLQQSFRFARYLHFPNDLARVIHNADARVLDRNIQSRKMVYAALLLLMLEAANADLVFTISLKRSTPNLQLSTNSPADYPIFGSLATKLRCSRDVRFTPKSRHPAARLACLLSAIFDQMHRSKWRPYSITRSGQQKRTSLRTKIQIQLLSRSRIV